MSGQVTVWYMTEEERLAYIEKHPIIRTERPSTYVSVPFSDKFKRKGEIGRQRIAEMHKAKG